ncbi:hypothetical protein ACFXTO_027769 [Malus domestica]
MAVLTSPLLNSPPQSFPPFLRRTRTSKTTVIRSSSSSSVLSAMDPHPPKRVVVCGGGVIGVCAAYFLSKRGAAVTLVEKSSVACAASGKAADSSPSIGATVSPSPPSPAPASISTSRSLKSSTAPNPTATDPLPLSASPSPNRRLPNPPESPIYRLGSTAGSEPQNHRTAETTAQVHPYLFTRTLISKAVEDYGVDVVIGKLETVGVENGRVNSVVLEGGRVIDSDAVVLAMGPWCGKFELLSSLFRVYGLKAHSIVLEPKEAEAITPHALFLSYYPSQRGKPLDPEVYPRPTGEVYVCGMTAEEEVPDDPEQIVGKSESIEVLKRVAGTVSSHLRGGQAQVKAEQACFLPCTDDGVPVIGEVPGVKGCYVATGHNCWGILNGPATGAAVAELVLDGKASIVDLSPFSPARFCGLKGSRR